MIAERLGATPQGCTKERTMGGRAMLAWDSIQANAVAFSKRWKDAHNEEA